MFTVQESRDIGLTGREWLHGAVRTLLSDKARSVETPMLHFPLPKTWGIDLYLKDESAHPTGSLKHRLARSMFLYGLCNGWISSTTTIVEASSGSTAVSEAHFARLLGLPFVAVMPSSTSREKILQIEELGGSCELVEDPTQIYTTASRIAEKNGGHYMDQFTYAERATDWTGPDNIAASMIRQLEMERFPEPQWVVIGAGTGGTSATIGRYLRYGGYSTRVCVVDPEGSAFLPAWQQKDMTLTAAGSRIEGIGRPRVEPSFIPTVIDHMIRVPDAASIAAMRYLRDRIPVNPGGSTGTNLWGALELIAEMRRNGQRGSVVTFICDGGERYVDTYYDDEWLAAQGLDPEPYGREIAQMIAASGENEK